MADIVSKKRRSENMSAIKCKDTKAEVYFRKKIFAYGLRYKKNCATVMGCPDAFLSKYNTAVFVNGCYWHRHQDCKYAYSPKSHTEFWNAKFDSNVKRDRCVREGLLSQGIKCLIVWECTVERMMKDEAFEADIVRRCFAFLQGADMHCEL